MASRGRLPFADVNVAADSGPVRRAGRPIRHPRQHEEAPGCKKKEIKTDVSSNYRLYARAHPFKRVVGIHPPRAKPSPLSCDGLHRERLISPNPTSDYHDRSAIWVPMARFKPLQIVLERVGRHVRSHNATLPKPRGLGLEDPLPTPSQA